jgi:hypothetical protein
MTNRLILAAGMPRAGSAWHYNLVHDLIVAGGGQDAHRVRARYRLGPFLTEVNCNIGVLKTYRVLPVLIPCLFGNTYAIKTHARPTPVAQRFIRRGWILPTYIYRDPRAALLSAYEYGRSSREKGRSNAFAALHSIEEAIEFMKEYVRVWEAWVACEGALHVRYEDLLEDYEAETGRLLDFLGFRQESPELRAVVDRYRPGRGEEQKGTHFRYGQAERFRRVLNAGELARCNREFALYLERMGYSPG